MKKNMTAVLMAAVMEAVMIAGCGGSGGSGTSTSTENTSTREEAVSVSDKNIETEGEEVEPETPTEVTLSYIEDWSNDSADEGLLGLELLEKENGNYLRVYYSATNLTDSVLYAYPWFSVKQGDTSIYTTKHKSHSSFKEFAAEEGFSEDEYLTAWTYFAMDSGDGIMPGITKYTVLDYKLESDEDVTMRVTAGNQIFDYTYELGNLPGAPDIHTLPRTEPVTDPEKWSGAVGNYTESGTISSKSYGDTDYVINEVTLEDDPYELGYNGKVIKVNVTLTNNGEKEFTGEVVIEKLDALNVYQDGCRMNLVLGSMSEYERRTKIAVGESAAVDIYFLPISDSPVMVVAGEVPAISSRGTEVNSGMVYSLE